MNSVLFWIWLNLSCTPGSGTFDHLLRAFSSPYEIYDADEAALRDALWLFGAWRASNGGKDHGREYCQHARGGKMRNAS